MLASMPVDLRLTKQFKFGERSSLLLIGEVFNLFNTTTYQVNRIRTTPATPTCWYATATRRILRDICNPRPSVRRSRRSEAYSAPVGRVHSNWHCDIAFRSWRKLRDRPRTQAVCAASWDWVQPPRRWQGRPSPWESF